MSCWRIDVRLLKPLVAAGRLLVVLHRNQSMWRSRSSTARLPFLRLIVGFTPVPRRSWSSTRSVYRRRGWFRGPYHATQYTAMGVPFEALLPYGIILGVRYFTHRLSPCNPITNTFTRSSSVSPAPVCPRSETFRTVASAPDTPSTSGTDKVRNCFHRDNSMLRKR
jgi:hypothetical protein